MPERSGMALRLGTESGLEGEREVDLSLDRAGAR